jgi:hypothetical protein
MTNKRKTPRKKILKEEATRIIDGEMVLLDRREQTIGLRTVSRKRKSPQTFLVLIENLRALLAGEINAVVEDDIYSFVKIHADSDSLRFVFSWLQNSGGESVAGYREYINIGKQDIQDMLDAEDGFEMRVLSVNRRKLPKLDFSGATDTLRNILADKEKKRAFVKALCRNFQYHCDSIRFYRDSAYSFIFYRADARRVSGGFVLHDSQKPRKGIRSACIHDFLWQIGGLTWL